MEHVTPRHIVLSPARLLLAALALIGVFFAGGIAGHAITRAKRPATLRDGVYADLVLRRTEKAKVKQVLRGMGVRTMWELDGAEVSESWGRRRQ